MVLPKRLTKAALHYLSSSVISGTKSYTKKPRLCLLAENQFVKAFSTTKTKTSFAQPIISIPDLQSELTKHVPDIQKSLNKDGFFATKSEYDILPRETIQVMRQP